MNEQRSIVDLLTRLSIAQERMSTTNPNRWLLNEAVQCIVDISRQFKTYRDAHPAEPDTADEVSSI